VGLRGLVCACAVLIAALAATGCGSGGLTPAGDNIRGKELFVGDGQCASCHTLADAGSKGVIGPNLDDAFRQARIDGLGEATIRSVVRDQIDYPIVAPNTGAPGMPADLLEGEDADAVASYVAAVAGLPAAGGAEAGGGTTTGGGESAAPDGEAIFAEAGCGGCHTLEAAGSSGKVGPNLDDAKPDAALVIERVTNGMGVMPSFKGDLTEQQIQDVAAYVSGATQG
jgi:cbb3-type cytochrome c oxidase subunit III